MFIQNSVKPKNILMSVNFLMYFSEVDTNKKYIVIR